MIHLTRSYPGFAAVGWGPIRGRRPNQGISAPQVPRPSGLRDPESPDQARIRTLGNEALDGPGTGVVGHQKELCPGLLGDHRRIAPAFAFDGLASFSTLPLKVWTYIGTIISAFAIVYAMIFAVKTLFFGADVPGFPSLIISVMFFSGIQLISLGVIGEYVGRIFAEVKRRPLYIVAEEVGGDPAQKVALGARREDVIAEK